jgi:hypothetical protein
MLARLVPAALALLLGPAVSLAQPGSIELQPLPPLAPAAEAPQPLNAPSTAAPPPPAAALAAPGPPAMSEPIGRVFCEQPVTVRLADRDTIAERFRPFVGIWSDAAWTPLLCAALIVENVAVDGTATILYVFGPMGSNGRAAGGVLQGTGVIRDGELRFQNSDGSQFAFRPLYADLDGRLTTAKNQSYQAVFKRTP